MDFGQRVFEFGFTRGLVCYVVCVELSLELVVLVSGKCFASGRWGWYWRCCGFFSGLWVLMGFGF